MSAGLKCEIVAADNVQFNVILCGLEPPQISCGVRRIWAIFAVNPHFATLALCSLYNEWVVPNHTMRLRRRLSHEDVQCIGTGVTNDA